MAITKILHINEVDMGNPARHLEQALDYIQNPEKTNGNVLVGSINCLPETAFERCPLRYRTPGKGAHLAPGRSLWGRKALPADGILDHVQQVAGVELGGGAAACEGLDESAVQRYVGDKLHDLLAAAEVPRGQNAVGSVGPELGRG